MTVSTPSSGESQVILTSVGEMASSWRRVWIFCRGSPRSTIHRAQPSRFCLAISDSHITAVASHKLSTSTSDALEMTYPEYSHDKALIRQRWQPPNSDRMHLLFRALHWVHLSVSSHQH